MDNHLTHTGVEVYSTRRFGTVCFVHVLDLQHVRIKLVKGFSSVTDRARDTNASLAFNANGWGLQPGSVSLSNEYLMIEGVVIQAVALDNRPCMNISKAGVIEFLDRPNFRTSYNVIGFDRIIARGGVYNTRIRDNSVAPRTVYGKDKFGSLVILVCEGRRAGEKGLTFAECWSVMREYDVTDCGNADGGYSSAAVNSFFKSPNNNFGLLNDSYKTEYRRTVMQVLFFADQLGEVTLPVEPEIPGANMKRYKVLIGVKPRKTPSMYETIAKPNLAVGLEFDSSAEKIYGITNDANSGVTFRQMIDGYWVPILYKGIKYLELIGEVTVPPPIVSKYVKGMFTDEKGIETLWLPQE